MNSRIGFGTVRHARQSPRRHVFTYPVFMPFLDLDELDTAFTGRWFWSAGRRNLAAFHREDYLGDAGQPLSEAVWANVEAALGPQQRGRIMLLANLRYWGYCFNPIAMYFCISADGSPIAMLADVTNTPWGERAQYVVPMSGEESNGHEAEKILHVSPFMPMQQAYHWSLRCTGSQIFVGISSHQDGERVFGASLQLQLRPATGPTLAKALTRHPFMTGRVLLGIYWQALVLRLKGMKYIPHPDATLQDDLKETRT